MDQSHIKDKIKALPATPGCYLFYNKYGDIIYIGKSKALKKRLAQHFTGGKNRDGKYVHLYREVIDFDTIETNTETDALILECELIKKHMPKYNAQLIRNKTYPLIKIDMDQKYPTISIVDAVENDGAHYFGSFYSNDDALFVIELLNNIWQTQLCNKRVIHKNKRACLHHHLGRCCGPCNESIEHDTYLAKINEIDNCLQGNMETTLERLYTEMLQASHCLDFEKAGRIKNSIEHLKQLNVKSKRLNTQLENKQLILFFSAYNEAIATIFYLDDGQVKASLTIPDRNQPDHRRITEFIEAIKAEKYSLAKNYIAQHLIQIHGDKYFLPIDIQMDGDSLKHAIIEGYKEYLGVR